MHTRKRIQLAQLTGSPSVLKSYIFNQSILPQQSYISQQNLDDFVSDFNKLYRDEIPSIFYCIFLLATILSILLVVCGFIWSRLDLSLNPSIPFFIASVSMVLIVSLGLSYSTRIHNRIFKRFTDHCHALQNLYKNPPVYFDLKFTGDREFEVSISMDPPLSRHDLGVKLDALANDFHVIIK